MGDVVMTSPVVRWLKLQLEAEVHFITKKGFAGLVSCNPYIDRIWTMDNNFDKLISDLRSAQYDIVVDLHLSLRSRRLCFHLDVPVCSFDKLTIEKWAYLLTRIDWLKEQHIVDRYLAGLRSLEIQNDDAGLDFFISDEGHVGLNLDNKPGVALVLGGSYVTKRLPFALVDKLLEDESRHYFLLGGSDVTGGTFPDAPHIHDYRGRCTVHQSASIINQCDVVVSGDTGMMHIAAALKKKLVVIWGSTAPVFGMYPWYPDHLSDCYQSIRVEGLTCQPCSKYGKPACPKKHMNCLNSIDPAKVEKAIQHFLPQQSGV